MITIDINKLSSDSKLADYMNAKEPIIEVEENNTGLLIYPKDDLRIDVVVNNGNNVTQDQIAQIIDIVKNSDTSVYISINDINIISVDNGWIRFSNPIFPSDIEPLYTLKFFRGIVLDSYCWNYDMNHSALSSINKCYIDYGIDDDVIHADEEDKHLLREYYGDILSRMVAVSGGSNIMSLQFISFFNSTFNNIVEWLIPVDMYDVEAMFEYLPNLKHINVLGNDPFDPEEEKDMSALLELLREEKFIGYNVSYPEQFPIVEGKECYFTI